MTTTLLSKGFQQILDAISEGVYVTDEQRRILYWSAGAERITGFKASEVVGKHCYDDVLVHTDLEGKRLCDEGCPLEYCISRKTDRTVNESFLRRKNGERVAVYSKAAALTDGDVTYGVEVFGELEPVGSRDLTAEVQKLSDSSVSDPLSGVFNRRYFDAYLEQQFAMWERLERCYGVLYLDVDDFKLINDALGHARGDDAIRFVAGVLSSGARKMDVVARYGGDEFAVICAVSTPAELESAALRVVRVVHDSTFIRAGEGEAGLTVSLGGTLVGKHDRDSCDALERADTAMCRAKRQGGDAYSILLPL